MTGTTESITENKTVEASDEFISQVYHCLECGKCTGSCPMVDLFPDDFHPHHLLTDFIYHSDKVLSGHSIWLCASCYRCNKRCPQNIELPDIFIHIRKMAIQENGMKGMELAFEKISSKIPFPLSFFSICLHPERIGLTHDTIRKLQKKSSGKPIRISSQERKIKVAVIGTGPAGLMAAHELWQKGYRVTMFESMPFPGGKFSMGVPEFRLPFSIVQEEIKKIKQQGITIKTNTSVGEELTLDHLFSQEYQAIFLAIGAHSCKRLGIEGEDLEGIYSSLEYLRELKTGKKEMKADKVIVKGGGNSAMDSASVAKRLGSKEVTLIYRRSIDQMPADPVEIRETKNAGVEFMFLTTPVRFIGEKNRVKQIECIKMELGKPDMSGRKRPIPVEGSNFILDADQVILALGEFPGSDFLPNNIKVNNDGKIVVNPYTMETSLPGVFAAGDDILGPATVAEAVSGARRAAIAIDDYLKSK